jgi:hypothetical protein
VQMAGGAVSSMLFTSSPNIASLSVPVGTSAVSGVVIIEASSSGVTGLRKFMLMMFL